MTFCSLLVTLLQIGRSRVIKKFSSQSQLKPSWPPLTYMSKANQKLDTSLFAIHGPFSFAVLDFGVYCLHF